MDKIKINLTSGSTIEKPLVTAFNGTGGTFVVLDNEMNGTMGLPIILVSKVADGKLVIVGDDEWNAAKESLRLIIAGNQVDYVKVADSFTADDNFFKQLTLPVASFDALKANYKVEEAAPAAAPAEPTPAPAEVTPAAPEMPADTSISLEPATPAAPTPEPTPAPAAPAPAPVEAAPTEPATPAAPAAPEVPEVPAAPVAPVMPEVPSVQEVAPVEPAPTPVPAEVAPVEPVAPAVDPIPEVEDTTIDLSADKEAFLKACENMFDALVAKLKG